MSAALFPRYVGCNANDALRGVRCNVTVLLPVGRLILFCHRFTDFFIYVSVPMCCTHATPLCAVTRLLTRKQNDLL